MLSHTQGAAEAEKAASGPGAKKDKKGQSATPVDPAAMEVLKAQAAAKCAESFKVCHRICSCQRYPC